MSKNRKECLTKDAKRLVTYVRAAPVKGRRYSEMLRKLFEIRKYSYQFDPCLDRHLLCGLMSRLFEMGVVKGRNGRYYHSSALVDASPK